MELIERDLYTADIDYIISKNIIEYDMKNAGYNLIKFFNLLPDDKIDYLNSLNKYNRTIQIGLYSRDDKKFASELTKSFSKLRKIFFDENNLENKNILSIKKDAIFVIGKECKKTKFKNIEFVKKNKYTSYHRFDNIEMYYRSLNNSLDIKGINNELLYQNEDFLSFLKKAFYLIETDNDKQFISFMKKFIKKYKERNLDINFYRELSPDSVFVLNENVIGSSDYLKIGISNSNIKIEDLDISYNYKKYILPLLQRFYFKNI